MEGERIGHYPASFRCAECGEIAGVVRTVRKGDDIDMGPPLRRGTSDRDAIVVDYFMGTHAMYADTATADAVAAIVSIDASDPAALWRIGWEIAPFWCPDCRMSYCAALARVPGNR